MRLCSSFNVAEATMGKQVAAKARGEGSRAGNEIAKLNSAKASIDGAQSVGNENQGDLNMYGD